jgi:hypothetical protein
MKDRRAEQNEAKDRRRLEKKYRPLRGMSHPTKWPQMGIDSPDEIYLQSSPAAAMSTVLTALQEHPVGFLNTLKTPRSIW